MAELDVNQTITTDTANTTSDYSIDTLSPDSPQDQEETKYTNSNFSKWFGHYKAIAKIKKAIDAYATWILGKGYETDDFTKAKLQGMRGWGEDTFQSIIWNLLVTKKVAGDAFAEIIRSSRGEVINLKPLSPEFMDIIANNKGLIKRYEYRSSTTQKDSPSIIKFKPNEILHLCNNRVVDEIHGVSDVEAVSWIVEAQEEAMRDHRTLVHRNVVPLRIIEVDEDNPTKLNNLKATYETQIKSKEVLIIPKGTVEIKDTTQIIHDPLPWIQYLDNLFYMSIGVPRVILGGSSEFTEASSKIGYLTFEQIYLREQTELEADLFAQVGIRITLKKPASLKNELLESEQKNTGQTGFQPTETQATISRNE